VCEFVSLLLAHYLLQIQEIRTTTGSTGSTGSTSTSTWRLFQFSTVADEGTGVIATPFLLTCKVSE
jgi:hypothetical protein